MKTFFPFRHLALVASMLACANAHAARPMVTDDANIVDPGACQLESWTQRTASVTEYWAVPACNLGGQWELAAGAGRSSQPDGANRLAAVRAKTVFRPLSTNDWGIGLSVASQFGAGGSSADNLAVVVPISASMLDDRVLVHANLGWQRTHGASSTATWSGGTEWNATSRLGLTLEAYGAGSARIAQAGARFALIADRLVLDAGAGQRLGLHGGARYITCGLTVTGMALR
jgi:hypothetical protein